MISIYWLALLVSVAFCTITKFEDVPLSTKRVIEDSFGVWTRKNEDSRPKLYINLTFTVSSYSASGRINVVLFREDDRNYIEASEKIAAGMGDCPPLAIDSESFQDVVYMTLPYLPKQELTQRVMRTISLNETGTWNLRFSVCQNKKLLLYTTFISGTLVWKNSFGYADTDTYYLFHAYLTESLGWFLVTLCWIFLLLRNKQSLSGYHVAALPILILCFIEAILLLADQFLLNRSGTPNWLILIMALAIGCIRRLTVMIVCFFMFFGVDIVRRSLNYEKKILLAGLSVAFLLGVVISSVTGLRYIQEVLFITSINTSLVHLPNVIFSSIFLGWALIGAYETMSKLRRAKSDALLQLFHSMVLVLSVSLILMTVVTVLKVVTLFDPSPALRPLEWLWSAFWRGNFFIVFVAFLVLWRPSPGTRTSLEELSATEEEESASAHSRSRSSEFERSAEELQPTPSRSRVNSHSSSESNDQEDDNLSLVTQLLEEESIHEAT